MQENPELQLTYGKNSTHCVKRVQIRTTKNSVFAHFSSSAKQAQMPYFH